MRVVSQVTGYYANVVRTLPHAHSGVAALLTQVSGPGLNFNLDLHLNPFEYVSASRHAGR